MKYFLSLFCVVIASCSASEPELSYEITSGENFEIETASYRGEPYYWEWVNPKRKSPIRLESRVYEEKFILSKMRSIGTETWNFKGKSAGIDTIKLYLRTFEEDSLGTPVADSLIIAVKVN